MERNNLEENHNIDVRLPFKNDKVNQIITAALTAVDPQQAVANYLHIEGSVLRVSHDFFDLSAYERVILVGFGKAVIPMAKGVFQVFGQWISSGCLISKHIPPDDINYFPNHIMLLKGNHPVPGIDSITSSQKLRDLIHGCTEKDLVLCLISGGGSALLTLPEPGISLEAISQLTQLLLASGASIHEINTLRKQLDQLKGGKLAQAVWPAKMISLILSDVVGNNLDIIASGPTVENPTSPSTAWKILEDYHLIDMVSPEIITILDNKKLSSQAKPLMNVSNYLVGSNYIAASAALEKAHQLNFNTILLSTFLQGEAKETGKILSAIIKQIVFTGQPLPRPACIIAGGETTVTLPQSNTQYPLGTGGRNMELALSAVSEIAGLPDVALVTLATDGEDGPTDAAGAIVTGDTLSRAQNIHIDPNDYLSRHDSYHFFKLLGDLNQTGPTGTNVNDLTFLFVF